VHARRNAAAIGEEAVHRRLYVGPRSGVIVRQRATSSGASGPRGSVSPAAAVDRCRDGQHGLLRWDRRRLRNVVEDEQRRPVHPRPARRIEITRKQKRSADWALVRKRPTWRRIPIRFTSPQDFLESGGPAGVADRTARIFG
jgi:hypothetical protein